MRRLAAIGLAGLALCATGCGAHHALSGAEPAVAPPVTRHPTGRVVSVGAAAEGIVVLARDGLIAVAVRDPDQIVLLEARSGQVRRRLRIAGPARHLALDGSSTLLVPEAPIDRLLELTLARGPRAGAPVRRRSLTTGSLPHDAVALDGRVFVADEFGRAVSVFAAGRALPPVRPFTQPGGIAAVAGRVALVDVGADTVSLIDPRTLRVLGRLRAGEGLTHDTAGPDGRLYVVDTRGGALLTFATRPHLRLLDRLALPGRPYGIASSPAQGRLWVTETASNTLVELAVNRPRPRVLARLATVRQPNTVAFDPDTGDVYVAGAAAGVVQTVHLGH